ncbi:C_GCAxxG_C_C family protein [Barnesiella sp. WM24]|uniref:C-GCAxxG-C-C family protein n=1 Tax=Barnesiella sp. WM24 TaxID=2558278 RepID=UPI0010728141|nr:C-GCAxxG-C-C family protein [Barnesiella sp. WM24]TFU94474.1 C_GCAxxG_C_C family protein [Barnesiella sp. WM24]
MNKVTLEARLERARQLRKEGYTCSQCVYMVFDDLHGLPEEKAAAVSCGLGGGIGGQHNVCGTVSALSLVAGDVFYDNPKSKMVVYSYIKDCSRRFADENGSIICAELLADTPRRKPCMSYIEDSITILHESLDKE